MRSAARALAALLFFAVLTLWMQERWPWALFQAATFLLAGWRLIRLRRWRIFAPFWPLAAASAWPWLQLWLGKSLGPVRTWNAALDWLTFLVLFALACDVFADDGARRWFLRAAVLFGTLLAAGATLQNYTSHGLVFWLFPSGYGEGVFGPFVNRGQYSAFIELLLPVALYLALTDQRRRALWSSAAAILFGSLMAAASRAGFALACVEVVAVLSLAAFQKLAPHRTLALAAVQIVMLAAIATAVTGWQGLQSRLEAQASEALRVDAVRASTQMVQDRPWFGAGLGTWPAVYPAYASFDAGVFMNQAHNDWAQWAAEGGLPFLFYLSLFAALSCRKAVLSVYGLGMAAFLLHALVDFPMQQRPGLAAWFFVVAGAATAWQSAHVKSALL